MLHQGYVSHDLGPENDNAPTTITSLVMTTEVDENSLFLIRRRDQTRDESLLGSFLKGFVNTRPAILGGTIDNAVIGATTPAAARVTSLNKVVIVEPFAKALLHIFNNRKLIAKTSLMVASEDGNDIIISGPGGALVFQGEGVYVARDTTDILTHKTIDGIDNEICNVPLDTAVAGVLPIANGGTGASTAEAARGGLGLGTMATQDAEDVAITGGSISGIDDLAVADGGTGASTAEEARTNLGLALGQDAQAFNTNLQALSEVPNGPDLLPYFTGRDSADTTPLSAFARGLLAFERADAARDGFGLGTVATQNAEDVVITGGSISGIEDLAVADGGTGASNPAGARMNLNLGSISTQSADDVDISGGVITGIADLSISDGGTGASTPEEACANLGIFKASPVVEGLVRLASRGEILAGEGDGAMTPADFVAGCIFDIPGRYVLPGGFEIKFGTFESKSSDEGTLTRVKFVKPFKNGCLFAAPFASMQGNGVPACATAFNYSEEGFDSVIMNPDNRSDINAWIYIGFGW